MNSDDNSDQDEQQSRSHIDEFQIALLQLLARNSLRRQEFMRTDMEKLEKTDHQNYRRI